MGRDPEAVFLAGVPPTKAPLTKGPTAFLGGYLEDPIDEIKRQFAKIKRQFEREGYEEAKEEFRSCECPAGSSPTQNIAKHRWCH